MTAVKTATVNVRIQEDIKEKAEKILESLGISRATAIEMFYRQIVFHNGIPFQVAMPSNAPTEENLDTLLASSLKDFMQGKTYSADEVFNELEGDTVTHSSSH